MEEHVKHKALMSLLVALLLVFGGFSGEGVDALSSDLNATITSPSAASNYTSGNVAFVVGVGSGTDDIPINLTIQVFDGDGTIRSFCTNTTGGEATNHTIRCSAAYDSVSQVQNGNFSFRAFIYNATNGSQSNTSANVSLGIDVAVPTCTASTLTWSSFVYKDESQVINVTCSDTGFTDGVSYVEYNDPYNGTINMSDLGTDTWGLSFSPVTGVRHNFRVRAIDRHARTGAWSTIQEYDVKAETSGEGGSSGGKSPGFVPREQRTARGSSTSWLRLVGYVVAVVVAISAIGYGIDRFRGKKKGSGRKK